MEEQRRQLLAGLEHCGLPASGEQVDLLFRWLALLERWNQAFNLTSIAPAQRIVQLILMSAALVPHLRGREILDVGSGAGVPGIPLAILVPDCSYTLLDSSGKKARFIKQSRLELRLENVSVEQSRVERFSGGKYDTIVSRAFAGLREFVSLTRHLGGSSSCWLAYKNIAASDEAVGDDVEDMVCEVRALAVPGLRTQNQLIIMRMK